MSYSCLIQVVFEQLQILHVGFTRSVEMELFLRNRTCSRSPPKRFGSRGAACGAPWKRMLEVGVTCAGI